MPTEMEQIREDATKALAKINKIDFNKIDFNKIDFKQLINLTTNAGILVKQLDR
jgi:hypothetical protein